MTQTTLIGGDTEAAPAASDSTPSNTDQQGAQGETTDAATPTDESPDGQSADGAQTQDQPATGEAAPKDGTTTLDLQLPEGTALDEDALGMVQEFAGAHELNGKQAQAVIDLLHQHTEKHVQAWADSVQKMRETVEADPDLGGDKLPETKRLASAALNAFFSKEFSAELARSGYGNHPELIRGLAKVGARVAERTKLPSGGPPAAGANPNKLFSNSPGFQDDTE